MKVGDILKVSLIKHIGEFDELFITSNISPLYNRNYLKLTDGYNLKETIQYGDYPGESMLATLKINIVGEKLDTSSMHKYTIGYAYITIVKGENITPNYRRFENLDNIQLISKSVDEINLCNAGLNIAKHLNIKGITKDNLSIAIINRVYINKEFRRLGINKWIHNNLEDIITNFALIHPDIVVLSYDDFANECNKNFGMTKDEYCKMLHTMYKKLGYKDLGIGQKISIKSKSSYIMFKIFKNKYIQ